MRGQQRHTQHSARFVDLAEESKSVLLDLGVILNQRYRGRGPSHQTQRSLQRKNEAVSRLEQFITDQQRVCETQERAEQSNTVQEATIERLEKQLEQQRLELEQERVRRQQQATAQAELNSSLRGLLAAYDEEQGQYLDPRQDTSTRTVTITGETCSNQLLTRHLNELRTAFDEERAQLLEQASDAAKTQQDISRKNCTERETALTCPISLDLFENPVLTTCCGRTFSSEALTQALRRNPQCPVCRAHRVLTHANRDVANLVELHRSQRSLLGLSENTAATSSATVLGSEEGPIDTGRSTALGGDRVLLTTSAARENQNRNARSQRAQARAGVPHRQSSTAPSDASPSEALPSTGSNSRGRRRGGRNSRQRRNSRSSSSSTPAAASQPAHHTISSTDAGPTSSGSASRLSGEQYPVWNGRSGNAASQSSMTRSGSAGYGSTQGYGYGSSATYLNPTSSLDAYLQLRSSSNSAPNQSSSPRYGRAPRDSELNFYAYAHQGYLGSDSDY
ncbi:Zinc-finger of the MIZ type in Nse subunit [Phytophthora infestans]|uniref:Zinc-finger of the MIZ type in Nse subunit n=1 Tax=Phytophthora infestans TaxID=4787 RepID=A0A8S9UCY5_PHYIN|nr:Zinc-finger of the MIZ type in Nse subunit [Phytophthora infestans]